MKNELIQKHLRLSPSTVEWYENESSRLGIPQTNLMQVVLDQYIQQTKSVDMGQDIKEFTQVMKTLILKETVESDIEQK